MESIMDFDAASSAKLEGDMVAAFADEGHGLEILQSNGQAEGMAYYEEEEEARDPQQVVDLDADQGMQALSPSPSFMLGLNQGAKAQDPV